jgi:hypothetical protein
MQQYLDKIITSGFGLWSDVIKEVKTTGYTVNGKSFDFGELRVFFDTSTWNVETDGLVYTDPAFLESVRVAFGTSDIEYSEQGMQGDDFVSFDVGAEFLNMYEGA